MEKFTSSKFAGGGWCLPGNVLDDAFRALLIYQLNDNKIESSVRRRQAAPISKLVGCRQVRMCRRWLT